METELSLALPYYSKLRRVQNPVINKNDRISKLSDILLQRILSMLSTKEAAKTSILSTRWKHLWKWRPHLHLDMRNVVKTTSTKRVPIASVIFAESMTKVLNNHRGNLESCTIDHYIYQSEDGTLENWIQTATRVKHTKELTLANYVLCMRLNYGYSLLNIAPDAFSHHSLTSLSLCQFKLNGTQGFKNCSNLKTLKLLNIIIAEVSILSKILAECSSLEVLLLQINHVEINGVLKIENNNLKYLQVFTPLRVNRIEVYATCLDVFDIRYVFCRKDDVILESPNVQFNRNYWISGGCPHLCYNITSLAQEKKRIWHELMVSGLHETRRSGSLSVSLDVTNPKEVDILKEVLLMWTIGEMKELEILFKNNDDATREEGGECFIDGRARRTLWENSSKPFPNADFRVCKVWMYNFSGSNKKEFAFASQFVKQKTVIEKIMIETSSLLPMKKLEVEAAVIKLMALRKGNKYLSIECF